MEIRRFCGRCDSEVADLGGFCVLGHPLDKEVLPASSLTDLRQEIESAFETARREVAEVVAAAAAVGPAEQSEEPRITPRRTPPPPPPPQAGEMSGLEEPVTDGDPISKFSPPPHMDWGPPEKSKKLFNRRRNSGPSSVEAAPEG